MPGRKEIKNRAIATADAAKLVLSGLEKVVEDTGASAKALSEAVFPLYGIRWNMETCQRVGPEIRHLIWRLRNSKMSPSNYALIRGVLCEAEDLAGPSPINWEQRCSALEQFGLDDRETMSQWRETVTNLATLGFVLPMDLAKLDFAPLMQITWGSSLGKEAKMLWHACVLAFLEPGTKDIVKFTGACDEAEKLLELAKGAEFNNTRLIRTLAGSTSRLNMEKSFPSLGPSAKIRALRGANLPRNKLRRYCEAGTRVNLLKSTRLSYKSLASGIRRYFSFCELKGSKPFSANESTAPERSSIFNESQTYQSYLNCLRKACFVLRYPAAWYTPAIIYAAR